MASWSSESRKIAEEVRRALSRNVDTLDDHSLLLARNEAKQVRLTIDRYQHKFGRSGRIMRAVTYINDGLTIAGGAVWAASLLGVAVLPALSTAAAIGTPLGAAYTVADRFRQRVRKKRIKALDEWSREINRHIDAIDRALTRRLLHPGPPAPS